MFRLELVNTLVTHANIKGFGLTPLFGDRLGIYASSFKKKHFMGLVGKKVLYFLDNNTQKWPLWIQQRISRFAFSCPFLVGLTFEWYAISHVKWFQIWLYQSPELLYFDTTVYQKTSAKQNFDLLQIYQSKYIGKSRGELSSGKTLFTILGELIYTCKMIQPGIFSRFSQPVHFSRL